jgi:hypothetical protein
MEGTADVQLLAVMDILLLSSGSCCILRAGKSLPGCIAAAAAAAAVCPGPAGAAPPGSMPSGRAVGPGAPGCCRGSPALQV